MLFSFLERGRAGVGEGEGDGWRDWGPGLLLSNMELTFWAVSCQSPSLFPALWLWASFLNSLQLYFLICKMEIKCLCVRVVVTYYYKCNNVHKVRNSVSSVYYPLTLGIYHIPFLSKTLWFIPLT